MRNRGITAAPRIAPPAFDRASLPTRLVQDLVAGWKTLCEDERDSVIAATVVAADLARLGAPPAILAAAARVVEDEVRHVAVCTTILDHLGSEPAHLPPERRRGALGSETPLELRTARALVAGFAVGEPMSAGCFAASRAVCREPLIRWALTELLRDEARHGAFGVEGGAWVMRGWSERERRTLWPECVAEMEDFERRLGGPANFSDGAAPDPQAAALGLLTTSQNCAAAVQAVRRWVIPSLAKLGVIATPLA